MFDDRNDDTHVYDESSALSYAARIKRDYLPFISEFLSSLALLIPNDVDSLITIPESFMKAYRDSGLDFDKFIKQKRKEFNVTDDNELFKIWDNKQKLQTIDLFPKSE